MIVTDFGLNANTVNYHLNSILVAVEKTRLPRLQKETGYPWASRRAVNRLRVTVPAAYQLLDFPLASFPQAEPIFQSERVRHYAIPPGIFGFTHRGNTHTVELVELKYFSVKDDCKLMCLQTRPAASGRIPGKGQIIEISPAAIYAMDTDAVMRAMPSMFCDSQWTPFMRVDGSVTDESTALARGSERRCVLETAGWFLGATVGVNLILPNRESAPTFNQELEKKLFPEVYKKYRQVEYSTTRSTVGFMAKIKPKAGKALPGLLLAVYNGPAEIRHGFIAGLFDTAARFTRTRVQDGIMVIGFTECQMAMDIQQILECCGYSSLLRSVVNKHGRRIWGVSISAGSAVRMNDFLITPKFKTLKRSPVKTRTEYRYNINYSSGRPGAIAKDLSQFAQCELDTSIRSRRITKLCKILAALPDSVGKREFFARLEHKEIGWRKLMPMRHFSLTSRAYAVASPGLTNILATNGAFISACQSIF